MKLEQIDRSKVKRAIKALEEAIYKLQQYGFTNDDWIEEIKLATIELEDLLE